MASSARTAGAEGVSCGTTGEPFLSRHSRIGTNTAHLSGRGRSGALVRGSGGSGRMIAMATFYFNTRTGQVEDLEDKSPSRDLLGPYATREEAQRALESAHERTEQWDEEDKAWNEGRPAAGEGEDEL